MSAPLPACSGAMLARLVCLGRRCGLQPEAVLLYVLDGAPLPETESELLRNIAQEMAGLPEHERPDVPPETLVRKGDRAIHLYGTTALSNPAIGRLIESTPQTVSWFIRKGRDRGDPLVAAGDRMRGRVEGDVSADTAEPAIVDEAAPIPPTEAEPDAWENDGLLFEFPEADPALGPGAQERLDQLNHRQFDGMLGDAAETTAAERPDERPSVDALSARQDEARTREIPSAKAVNVSSLSKYEAALELWAKTDLSYVDIAHQIGSTQASVYERIRQAKKRNDPRWAEGQARRTPQPGAALPAGANAGGEHDLATQPTQTVTGNAAGEPSVGDEPVAQPLVSAEQMISPEGAHERPRSRVQIPPGSSVACEGAPVAQSGRAGQNGDAGSNPVRAPLGEPGSSADRAPSVSPDGASEVASELVAPPAPEPAGSPAPLPDPPPAEDGTVRRASGNAVRPAGPGPDSENSGIAPELPDGHVVAINAGWIVGPAGTVKGFPLVNAILQVLAKGDLLGAGAIAQRASARSPAAVLAVLDQWRGDLENVGVEILRFGQDSIRLRRMGAR